ncbi:MAG: hypothetical protein GY798_14415 [Hyphomicrobiales bacterium]|nr:hypothetical protein [Hyphomicrobiales bacterium]
MPDPDTQIGASEITEGDVREALTAILASSVFDGALRLQEFLTYVVEESLAGRGDKIPAKLVAQDVYGRSAGTTADEDNVVRVDAGRLRRRLDQYYLDVGKSDPVRIHIDPGGYAPRFEDRKGQVKSDPQQEPNLRWGVIAAWLLIGVIVVTGLVYLFGPGLTDSQSVVENVPQHETGTVGSDQRALERQAIAEKSHASLQAVNLAEQARGLIFPIFDVERLRSATEMFRRAIRLDDHHVGGYAGAAQTLGALALLHPPGAERDDFLAGARAMVDRAMVLDPANSWTQSAAGWVAFTGQEFDDAIRLSQRAMELSPDDGNVLDFHGLIALFTGEFEVARDIADPARSRMSTSQRLANRNIYAAASFHLGDYGTTIEALGAAAELGDPVSAPALAYLAAAYHALGDVSNAREMAEELSVTWPDYRADVILRRIYRHREHSNAIVKHLLAAGWVPPSQTMDVKSSPE